ncbi:MAG: CocE/NonD family hydrolase [Pirellulales bacterium]|nr:CocE/NonD family hydrolase [Pirellulales bacterium]
MRTSLRHAVLCFAALLAVHATATADDKKPAVARGAQEEMVAMRDGVKLATNIYLPKGKGPWPVVLTRTPYSKDGMFGSMSGRYTGADYVFVIQDTRGRFRSEGEYRPFETDRDDGFDTVAWIAKQPWCDGNIGMSGASAMGITSLLAAEAQPPALKAAYVIVAPESIWSEASWIGGVFKEADVTGWLKSQNAEDQIDERRATMLDLKMEQALDIIHSRDKIQIPIYHLGGWYDIFSTGTQGNFAYLHNQGAQGAKGRQKLMMGPFGHGNLAGDLRYKGDGGILGVMRDEIRWFDHYLKGQDNGVDREPAVKYYQMASAMKKDASDKNGWRTADNWPPKSTATRYYLSEAGSLTTTAPTTAASSTKYVHDPKNPVPTVGGANLTLPLGPKDQREIGDRADYLRFTTEPLATDVSIAGPVSADLYVSTDAPDTDYMVKLVDVYPDGYEAIVLDAPVRALFREGRAADKIKPMEANQPTRIEIPLGGTALTFEKGHRIAVHVSSSNYPRFEVNQGNGALPNQPPGEPRAANNAVYHDADHPTAIVLPVVE